MWLEIEGKIMQDIIIVISKKTTLNSNYNDINLFVIFNLLLYYIYHSMFDI